MATYYADSSVLVKRHVVEVGTLWVQALTDPAAGHLFVTSRISIVEVISALNRRQREGTVSAAEYARISTDFTALSATTYQLVEFTEEVVDQARGTPFDGGGYFAKLHLTDVGAGLSLMCPSEPLSNGRCWPARPPFGPRGGVAAPSCHRHPAPMARGGAGISSSSCTVQRRLVRPAAIAGVRCR